MEVLLEMVISMQPVLIHATVEELDEAMFSIGSVQGCIMRTNGKSQSV
jgi:hypothetical protein